MPKQTQRRRSLHIGKTHDQHLEECCRVMPQDACNSADIMGNEHGTKYKNMYSAQNVHILYKPPGVDGIVPVALPELRRNDSRRTVEFSADRLASRSVRRRWCTLRLIETRRWGSSGSYGWASPLEALQCCTSTLRWGTLLSCPLRTVRRSCRLKIQKWYNNYYYSHGN